MEMGNEPLKWFELHEPLKRFELHECNDHERFVVTRFIGFAVLNGMAGFHRSVVLIIVVLDIVVPITVVPVWDGFNGWPPVLSTRE